MPYLPPRPFLVSRRMTFIKSNDWYYKPNSAPTAPVGGSCNRAILHAKGRRTSGPAPIVVFGAGPATKHIPANLRLVNAYTYRRRQPRRPTPAPSLRDPEWCTSCPLPYMLCDCTVPQPGAPSPSTWPKCTGDYGLGIYTCKAVASGSSIRCCQWKEVGDKCRIDNDCSAASGPPATCVDGLCAWPS